MPDIFDEANKATEELFAMEGQEAPAEEVPVEGTPTEGAPAESVPAEAVPAEETPAEGAPTETAIGQAAQTAEIAAQVASEKDAQLQQVLAQMEAIKQQNAQLQGTIEELSRQNEEHIVEEA